MNEPRTTVCRKALEYEVNKKSVVDKERLLNELIIDFFEKAVISIDKKRRRAAVLASVSEAVKSWQEYYKDVDTSVKGGRVTFEAPVFSNESTTINVPEDAEGTK